MRAPEWLWHPSRLRMAERAIYASLLRYRNSSTGLAWPAVESIAADLGVSRHTVMRSLRALEAWGLIATSTRRQAGVRRRDANTYTVHVFEEMPPQIRLPESDQVAQSDVVDQVADSDMVDRPSRKTAPTMSQKRSDHVAVSDRNPIEEPHRRTPFESASAHDNNDAWSDDSLSDEREEEKGDADVVEVKREAWRRLPATRPQVDFLADIYAVTHWEMADDEQRDEFAALTQGEASDAIRDTWRDAEHERFTKMLRHLPAEVFDCLSDEGRRWATKHGYVADADVWPDDEPDEPETDNGELVTAHVPAQVATRAHAEEPADHLAPREQRHDDGFRWGYLGSLTRAHWDIYVPEYVRVFGREPLASELAQWPSASMFEDAMAELRAKPTKSTTDLDERATA